MNNPAPPAVPPTVPPPISGGTRTSVTAIVSLVAGVLGWTFLPMLGSIVAIITGHLARSEIRHGNGSVEGDGLAITGLVLGYAMVVVSILSLLVILMMFGGLAAFFALVASGG